MKKLIVIKDNKDGLEKLFQKLVSEPESFTEEAFKQLVDTTFDGQLTPRDKVTLIAVRRKNGNVDPVAQNALRAILNRQDEEFERLLAILDHRHALTQIADPSNSISGNDVTDGMPRQETGHE